MVLASLILMLITSAGAFGFLSGEFQKAIADTSSQTVLLTALNDEQIRLQTRKTEIDSQVSQLKTDNVRGRTTLMRQFGPEVTRINKRLEEIDKELPALKVEAIKKNVEVGPIIYVAEAFHTTPEQAVKWVILVIIFVFDPLAIALLIAGNYLLRVRKAEKELLIIPKEEELVEEELVDEEFKEELVEEELKIQNEKTSQFFKFASEIETLLKSKLTKPDSQEIEPVDEVFQLSAKLPVPYLEVEIIDAPVPTELQSEIIETDVHRSLLEDFDGKKGDVVADDEDRERTMRHIYSAYRKP